MFHLYLFLYMFLYHPEFQIILSTQTIESSRQRNRYKYPSLSSIHFILFFYFILFKLFKNESCIDHRIFAYTLIFKCLRYSYFYLIIIGFISL